MHVYKGETRVKTDNIVPLKLYYGLLNSCFFQMANRLKATLLICPMQTLLVEAPQWSFDHFFIYLSIFLHRISHDMQDREGTVVSSTMPPTK